MDPRINPFAPGAGTQPPYFVGRDNELERAFIALDRIRTGLSARSFFYYGLRGVGKTVLLNRIRVEADSRGFASMMIEAHFGRSLPINIARHLRSLLLKLSRTSKAKEALQRAFGALASFVGALKVKYGDVEFGVDVAPEKGLADSGDLAYDLMELFEVVAYAAQSSGTAVVVLIDELEAISNVETEILIAALHVVCQKRLPFLVIAAGLPSLLAQIGNTKSYADRLFEFIRLDPFDSKTASLAIRLPLEHLGVGIEDSAVDAIVSDTVGYPYFLQEWGKHAWNSASDGKIRRQDAENAKIDALSELDESFFWVRFERLTEKEKEYVKGMAALGCGPFRSGAIAEQLGRVVTAVAVTRNSLVQKGVIYSPSYGETAFTVPLFDDFLRRIMSIQQ